jgi:hypothetical protein
MNLASSLEDRLYYMVSHEKCETSIENEGMDARKPYDPDEIQRDEWILGNITKHIANKNLLKTLQDETVSLFVRERLAKEFLEKHEEDVRSPMVADIRKGGLVWEMDPL